MVTRPLSSPRTNAQLPNETEKMPRGEGSREVRPRDQGRAEPSERAALSTAFGAPSASEERAERKGMREARAVPRLHPEDSQRPRVAALEVGFSGARLIPNPAVSPISMPFSFSAD